MSLLIPDALFPQYPTLQYDNYGMQKGFAPPFQLQST